jgi:hypothetical protein
MRLELAPVGVSVVLARSGLGLRQQERLAHGGDVTTPPALIVTVHKTPGGSAFTMLPPTGPPFISALTPARVPSQPSKTVYLGEEYINNKTLSDVTFTVEGRPFYAHRIALLASSDAFRAMFGGGYREGLAASITIPNIE